ncbi:flagellar hook-length control protein FliK [Paracoccus sp. MBLB3053]|uniref:Flagellar hook-length control protein FliK n=1 Tax=Paracoccus aurantius TaxID=3073814 RepID=A0ABU2HM14_9RHOB|nr:flagellar hook-length control protein FliK [Paracoccus sp. MBLB3053]MDS9466064.1 flagellar hook-length control protein FliK [Paracoccus sp. MBLB3053]
MLRPELFLPASILAAPNLQMASLEGDGLFGELVDLVGGDEIPDPPSAQALNEEPPEAMPEDEVILLSGDAAAVPPPLPPSIPALDAERPVPEAVRSHVDVATEGAPTPQPVLPEAELPQAELPRPELDTVAWYASPVTHPFVAAGRANGFPFARDTSGSASEDLAALAAQPEIGTKRSTIAFAPDIVLAPGSAIAPPATANGPAVFYRPGALAGEDLPISLDRPDGVASDRAASVRNASDRDAAEPAHAPDIDRRQASADRVEAEAPQESPASLEVETLTPVEPDEQGQMADEAMTAEVRMHPGRDRIGESAGPAVQAQTRSLPQEPKEVMRQIADRMVTSDEARIEVTLSPEELGKVRLVMSSGETPTVTVYAEHRDTLEFLRRHGELLARELRDTAFAGAAFSFSDGDGDGDGAGQRPQRAAGRSQTAGRAHAVVPSTEPQAGPDRPILARQIDIRI